MYCPKCNAQNSDQAVQCGFCGANLRELLPPQPQPPQPPQQPYPLQPPQQPYAPQERPYPPPQGPYPMGPGGYPPPPAMYGPKPNNNLAGSIIVTLLCCWPLGIVSIIYAAKVDGLWMSGDYGGAVNAANTSKNWMYASIAGGALAIIVYILLIAATGFHGTSHSFR